MSPQPDCGKGFVVSFVAASNDDGSLDFSSEAWKDGVAGAFSGAFSGMKAKGFFADEAASGDAAARRFGFLEGGGEKTNSGATGAAAAALPKIDGGFAGATGAPSSSGAVKANSSSSSSSSSAGAGAGAGGEKGAAAGGENGDAGAGAGGAEKLNGLAAAGAGAGAGGAEKLNGLAAAGAGAGDSAFGASGDANGLAGAAPKG